ncbi:ornithine cyclodeaminase family protein [Cryobacterium sp. PH31-O1]|uniref:ornithine cyclodeaminase family protein n=1 Tax=Cryobacterium sp. PH31-O1 TaxID=3046306 RepID=UPI0024B9167D|nr:ornithine cyclodeaminase family protein [Cryobacterium sp. PH31-O1]MDJ0338943.1 ornithine cyclodeaminase family protein [Cryobacterium sp. PH31-O1]
MTFAPEHHQNLATLVSAAEIFERVNYRTAVRAVQNALTAGLNPAQDFARQVLPVANGQLLLMPTEAADFVGIKVASVAPGNPALGRERIQGVYLLLDAVTLTPLSLLDGAAITTLRTPAVSAAAADYLAPAEVEHLVVFGSGPQAWGHIEAMRAIRSINRVTIVGRDQARAALFAARVTDNGLPARVGTAAGVASAQLVVCATTARTPLFDGSLVPDECCIVAVGSHEADARELDSALLGRSQVVVEDLATAKREAGDVILAVFEGAIGPTDLVPLRDIVLGTAEIDPHRPRIFKSTGMSWEDLVIATAVYQAGARHGQR